MAKSDLLKQAIADANAVKETALANAKIALQEAFEPRIQSMLSRKISEELEDEDEMGGEMEAEPEMDAAPDAEGAGEEMGDMPDSVNVGLDFNDDGDWDLEGTLGSAEEEESDVEPEAEAGAGDVEPDMSDEEAEGEYNEELNLEQIIRELEGDLEDPVDAAEMGDMGDDEDMIEDGYDMGHDDDDMIEDGMNEQHSGFLRTVKKAIPGKFGDKAINKLDKAIHKSKSSNKPPKKSFDTLGKTFEGRDEDEDSIDEIIEAILREESGMDDMDMNGGMGMDTEMDTDTVPAEDYEQAVDELQEAYRTVRHLKGIINEVNLLNAKLLYTNKLFRNFELNDGQKMKVIENFDRAGTTREVKLVFTTLAESFTRPTKKRVVKESYASRPVTGTAPSQNILNEGFDFANRWKKLAGLL